MEKSATDQHQDRDIARAVLELVAARGPERTICPSEAARLLAADGDWRTLMPRVHAVVEQLAMAGAVTLTQKGRPVKSGRPRGAYRIRQVR